MEILDLKVKKRDKFGKKGARIVRTRGEIPAIFYGHGFNPQPLSASAKDFKGIISTPAGTNVIVNLGIEGEKPETAMIKEIQKDPTKDSYLHVDFLKIAMSEEIETSIPLVVGGDSPGVKEGGVLQHSLWEILVKALPKSLPDRIEVDIGSLGIGDALRVSDIPAPEDVTILTSGDEMVVSIVPPTELKEEELVPEEEVEPEVIGEKEEEEVPEAKEQPKKETDEG